MKRASKFSREVRERTVRMGMTLRGDHPSQWPDTATGTLQPYLNANLMAAWLRDRPSLKGELDMQAYFNDLEARRASPSGIFGIKTH